MFKPRLSKRNLEIYNCEIKTPGVSGAGCGGVGVGVGVGGCIERRVYRCLYYLVKLVLSEHLHCLIN